MSTNIVVPELGESIVEATVIRWFKSEGDSVKIGEALLELETEKANFEVAAEKQGVITSILKKEDDDVEVGEVLGVLEEGAVSNASSTKPVVEEAPEAKQTTQAEQQSTEKITPVAKNLAEEYKIDTSNIDGTGPSGRITKEDVEKHMQTEIEESEIEASVVEPVHNAPVVISTQESDSLFVSREVEKSELRCLAVDAQSRAEC